MRPLTVDAATGHGYESGWRHNDLHYPDPNHVSSVTTLWTPARSTTTLVTDGWNWPKDIDELNFRLSVRSAHVDTSMI